MFRQEENKDKQSEKVTMIPYCLGDELSSENINEIVESIVNLSSDKLQDDYHKSIVSKTSNELYTETKIKMDEAIVDLSSDKIEEENS